MAVIEFAGCGFLPDAWFFSISRPQHLFACTNDMVKAKSCMLLSYFTYSVHSPQLCFRPSFCFVMLCLSCLQLSLFISPFQAYMFVASLHRRPWFLPLRFQMSFLNPPLRFSISPAPILILSFLSHLLPSLSDRLARVLRINLHFLTCLPRVLTPCRFVSREVPGLKFQNLGARSAFTLVRNPGGSVVACPG